MGRVKGRGLTDKQRILRNIVVDDSGCWVWQRHLSKKADWPNGRYGTLTIPTEGARGKTAKAHRVSYAAFNGPIPAGMGVLHTCDNTRCCNPQHLFLGTNFDNMGDCKRKKRNYIPAGELNGKAKITAKDALTIRRMFWIFRIPHKIIMAQFNLSSQSVSNIVRCVSWQCATGAIEASE